MRRNYLSSHMPQKPFITTYHVCEVPLPYYNPLEDPHLKGYFSNRKVNHHIQQFGLVYKPRKQYPYQERRAKNGHKFLKLNLCETPSTHILPQKNIENKSCIVGRHADLLSQSKDFDQLSPVLKRKAASELFQRIGKRSYIGDVVQKMPYTHNSRKRNFSSEITNKTSIFKRRHSSNKRQENAEESPEIQS